MSRFNGARAHIFVWTRACTCVLPTWGESQLGFRELANRPVRDAHRKPWLAPSRPALKATVVEHRLSKHWDSQCMARAPQWLVRRFQLQVGSWLRVGLAGGALQVSVSAMELRNIYRANLAADQESRLPIFSACICENINSIIHPPARTHMANVSALAKRTNSSPLLHQYCTIIQESNT
jgi:hypothetical protein